MKKSQGYLFLFFGLLAIFLIVTVAFLIVYGFLDISKWIPIKCQLDNDYKCKEYRITENAILMQLENNIGYTVHIYELTYTLSDGTICSWTGDFLMADEDVHTYVTICPFGNTTAVQRIKMELKYFKTLNAMHTVLGEMVGKVKGSYTFDLQTEGPDICSSAQVTNVCDGIDALLGPGTKRWCQDEYGLCL